jgi:hypothetical protein
MFFSFSFRQLSLSVLAGAIAATAFLMVTAAAAQDVPQKDVFCNNRVINAGLGQSAECVSSCGSPRFSYPFPADDPACFNGLVCCYDPVDPGAPVDPAACGQAATDSDLTQGECTTVSNCTPPTFEQVSNTPYPQPLCPIGQVCCGRQPTAQPPSQSAASSTALPTRGAGRGELNNSQSYLINPLPGRTVPQLIGQIIRWVSVMAGALFMLYLLWGGAEWMSAAGDDGRLKSGRQRIVAAVAGIVVVLLAYTLVSSIVGVIPQ